MGARQVMPDLLQLSLFKLAEEYHGIIDALKVRNPDRTEELNDMGCRVEVLIHEIMEKSSGLDGKIPMEIIDMIHMRITEAKTFLS